MTDYEKSVNIMEKVIETLKTNTGKKVPQDTKFGDIQGSSIYRDANSKEHSLNIWLRPKENEDGKAIPDRTTYKMKLTDFESGGKIQNHLYNATVGGLEDDLFDIL